MEAGKAGIKRGRHSLRHSGVSFWSLTVITNDGGLRAKETWLTGRAFQMTDEELLERGSRGDETAFRTLYERHRDPIFRFSWRMCGDAETAEDITHDCFLSLISQPGRFVKSHATLRTYLLAAARNQALKRISKRSGVIAIDDVGIEPESEETRQPLSLLLAGELSAAVRDAIAALPEQQREALILFEYQELSLAEVGQVVGAGIGAVKARLYRARDNLRRMLAPYRQRCSISTEECKKAG